MNKIKSVHKCNSTENCGGTVFRYNGVFQCVKCGCYSRHLCGYKEGSQPISNEFRRDVVDYLKRDLDRGSASFQAMIWKEISEIQYDLLQTFKDDDRSVERFDLLLSYGTSLNNVAAYSLQHLKNKKRISIKKGIKVNKDLQRFWALRYNEYCKKEIEHRKVLSRYLDV